MKTLIPILIGLLVVGCVEKQSANTNEGNSTPIKTAKKKSATPLTPEEHQLFDMVEMYDASTLEVSVIKDWHTVGGEWPTRQKVIEITVGKATPEADYRVMVQFAVPEGRKATGFHLTGSVSNEDIKIRGFEGELIDAGIGLVKTRIDKQGMGDLRKSRVELFYKTLDPRYRNFWIWPATFMRAITAAYAEQEHFEEGKILVSGGSKGGELRR